MDQARHIADLFFRRLQNGLSADERQELESWLDSQDPESRRFFEAMTDWEEIRKALYFMYSLDHPQSLAIVREKIRLEERSRLVPWRRVLNYAAIVLLVAGLGGGLWVMLHPRKIELASVRYHSDVSPGGNRAILELADGKRVVLDSASNGLLANQGNARVMKTDDGRLSYQATAGPAEVLYNTVSTPRGGQYEVTLPDGTRAWLNAASSLRFPTRFTGGQRLVTLSGEAYFEIAGNSNRPFMVQVEHAIPETVEVLGTRFDVQAYADEPSMTTTLLDGSIKVVQGGQQALLAPGQQASIASDGALKTSSSVDTAEVIAWKKGLFQFRGASLNVIMRQVARWYNVDVEYDGNVTQRYFGKIPRSVNLSNVLKILESTDGAHFKIEGNKVLVMSQ